MTSKTKQILKDLQKEEKVKDELISLYTFLLEAGQDKANNDEKNEFFCLKMEKLKEDSKHHKKIISEMMNKYQE